MPVRISTTLVLLAITTIFAAAVWGQAAPAQKWKDRAEYDLYAGAADPKTDNAKKLELLNTWKEKYPTTEFKTERLALFLNTYSALNQPDKVLETGNEILAADPKNIQAIYLMTASGPRLVKPTPEQLAMVDKAARTLTANIDSLKPAGVADAAWNAGKTDLLTVGYTTLGTLAMNRKDYEAAEKEFTACLKVNPNNGPMSYTLGTAMLAEKNADKYSAALYHIARAASYAGAGASPEAARKVAGDYLTKTYTSYHGSADGLDEIRKTASEQVFPPEGFTIESKQALDIKKEEEFKKSNPMMALWQTVKTELSGANGQTYFDSSMKGAMLPGGAGGVSKFKGTLVALKPVKLPKQLVLAISDATTPEVTLNLEEALPGTAPVGTLLEFEGVASAFTGSPFSVTFDIEAANLSGWPVAMPPAAKKAAGGAAPKAPAKK